MKPKLLIVSDDEAIRVQMSFDLSKDYDVWFVQDRASAVEAFETTSPAVTLLDLDLPSRPNDCEEGMTALSEFLAINHTARVIVICERSDKRNAIQAVGAGAYDLLCKPVEMDTLKVLLHRCIHVVELEKDASYNKVGGPKGSRTCSLSAPKCNQSLL